MYATEGEALSKISMVAFSSAARSPRAITGRGSACGSCSAPPPYQFRVRIASANNKSATGIKGTRLQEGRYGGWPYGCGYDSILSLGFKAHETTYPPIVAYGVYGKATI